MSNSPKKTGRPTEYDPAFHDSFCFELYAKGKTHAEVAKECGLSPNTLYEWQKKHPLFAETIKRARDAVDATVEASLFKRATGYEQPDTHIGTWQGEAVVTPIIKHIAPDPTSMIFWLKNRKPKEWRDKIDADMKIEAGDGLVALIAKIRSGAS